MSHKRRRWLRWSLGVAASLALALGAGWSWLDSLFEEPGAKLVGSLPRYLGDASVLGVFAHPDDELFVAGLLHDAARRPKGWVNTITLTRGENGYYEPYICRRTDLAAVRMAELLKYGFFLGVAQQVIWDYKDGGFAATAQVENEILRKLVDSIRSMKPDLIVTFDPSSGLSMHEDHMATGRLTTRAASLAGDPAYAPELGHAHLVRHLAYVEAPRKLMRTLGGDIGLRVAISESPPDFAITAAASIKRKGWDIHESQREFFRRSYGIPAWLLYALQDKEYYAVRTIRPESGR
jgi:LmbE family N-acetylglucosaminyl deacetylase